MLSVGPAKKSSEHIRKTHRPNGAFPLKQNTYSQVFVGFRVFPVKEGNPTLLSAQGH